MNPLTVIQPLAASSEDASSERWRWWDASGKAGQGTINDLGQAVGDRKKSDIVLLVPGEWALMAEVELPTRNPSRIRQALPFALEEHLLDAPEETQCAAGLRTDDGRYVAAAISPATMANLLNALRSVGVTPTVAVPDALCLPWQPGRLTRLADGERVLFRWGKGLGAAVDAASDSSWLEMLADPDRYAVDSVFQPEGGPFSVLAEEAGNAPVNLLQGDFAPAAERSAQQVLRWPALLAAAALALAIGLEMAKVSKLQAQSDQMATTIVEEFQSVFPEVQRIQADPAPQIELALRELKRQGGSDNHMLEQLRRVAPQISASTGISLRQLRYHEGRMNLEVSAERMDQFDALLTRIESTGLVATLGATRVDTQGVSGSIIITEPGSADA